MPQPPVQQAYGASAQHGPPSYTRKSAKTPTMPLPGSTFPYQPGATFDHQPRAAAPRARAPASESEGTSPGVNLWGGGIGGAELAAAAAAQPTPAAAAATPAPKRAKNAPQPPPPGATSGLEAEEASFTFPSGRIILGHEDVVVAEDKGLVLWLWPGSRLKRHGLILSRWLQAGCSRGGAFGCGAS